MDARKKRVAGYLKSSTPGPLGCADGLPRRKKIRHLPDFLKTGGAGGN